MNVPHSNHRNEWQNVYIICIQRYFESAPAIGVVAYLFPFLARHRYNVWARGSYSGPGGRVGCKCQAQISRYFAETESLTFELWNIRNSQLRRTWTLVVGQEGVGDGNVSDVSATSFVRVACPHTRRNGCRRQQSRLRLELGKGLGCIRIETCGAQCVHHYPSICASQLIFT